MKHYILFFPILLVSLFVVTQVSLASSWTSPTENPPNGNAEAPINVSYGPQTKFGGLTVGSSLGGGLLKAASKFFTGSTPSAALSVPGGTYLAEVQGDIGAARICGLNGVGCMELPLNLSATGSGNSKWATSTFNANDIYNNNLNGKVGIGNSNPRAPLSIGVGSAAANNLEAGTTATFSYVQGYNRAVGGYAPLRFYGSSINLQPESGNVGIGMTGVPGAKLDVVGDVQTTGKLGVGGLGTEKLTVNGRIAFTKPATDETNAGKIDYRGFYPALNIVGAGTADGNRQVRIFDKLLSPNYCDENGNNCKSITQMGATTGTTGSLSCTTVTNSWSNSSGADVFKTGLEASCPAGYQVTGGGGSGYKYGPDSWPSSDTTWRSDGTVGAYQIAYIYARCCKVQ